MLTINCPRLFLILFVASFTMMFSSCSKESTEEILASENVSSEIKTAEITIEDLTEFKDLTEFPEK